MSTNFVGVYLCTFASLMWNLWRCPGTQITSVRGQSTFKMISSWLWCITNSVSYTSSSTSFFRGRLPGSCKDHSNPSVSKVFSLSSWFLHVFGPWKRYCLECWLEVHQVLLRIVHHLNTLFNDPGDVLHLPYKKKSDERLKAALRYIGQLLKPVWNSLAIKSEVVILQSTLIRNSEYFAEWMKTLPSVQRI